MSSPQGTDGRPGYARLTEALEALIKRFPDATVHTMVDSMFAHLLLDAERPAAVADRDAGRLIETPRGTVGGVSALVLSLAAEKNAVVVSDENLGDFTAEHPWLKDPARVLGATFAGGVWVFTPRRID